LILHFQLIDRYLIFLLQQPESFRPPGRPKGSRDSKKRVLHKQGTGEAITSSQPSKKESDGESSSTEEDQKLVVDLAKDAHDPADCNPLSNFTDPFHEDWPYW
jgi:hypothetical protein